MRSQGKTRSRLRGGFRIVADSRRLVRPKGAEIKGGLPEESQNGETCNQFIRSGQAWKDVAYSTGKQGDGVQFNRMGSYIRTGSQKMAYPECTRFNQRYQPQKGQTSRCGWKQYKCWEAEPRLGRVAHGMAHRANRLKALGNGQVPAVVATAWEILNKQD